MWVQVGARIEQLRKDRKLTKTQFGAMIGVTGQFIGMMERGAAISVETITNLCRVMEVSADYLLFGVVDPNSMAYALKGLTPEQIGIALDILKRVAQLINTEDGNEALIQEVLRQQQNTP